MNFSEVVEVFRQAYGDFGSEEQDVDVEALFLKSIISELNAVNDSVPSADIMDDMRLYLACSRIPGLLYLSELYRG